MMQKKWDVYPTLPPEVNAALQEYKDGFRQLLYNRGVQTAEEADRYLRADGSLYDPFLLNGMATAVQRILAAIERQEQIVVYGDYDVDGVTATALLVQVLQALGGDVKPHIPSRFEEGYGLNVQTLRELAAAGAQLIITVDCGVRSVADVIAAKENGIEMIISDHHQPGLELPPAVAIINPHAHGCDYPEKVLSGVGVAYKIACALVRRSGRPDIDVDENLDLVALGTVADIVPLRGENRALVKAGLRRLRLGQRLGLNALAAAARLSIHNLTARDLGFMLGPRLNAAGRLESARTAYDLLVTQDPHEASRIAQQLDDLNRQRQGMVNQMVQIALDEETGFLAANIILSFKEEYEQGVVGLVASRIADRFYRPAIIGQIKGDLAVASCRSIPDFHITQALDQVKELFIKHGGHDMAAGFTIPTASIPDLKLRLAQIADGQMADKNLCPILWADMEIDLRKLPSNILERLDEIEPTGQENPEVRFISRNVEVLNPRAVGEGQHLSLLLKDGQKTYRGIAFRKGELFNTLPERVDILYVLMRNEFNGLVSTELNVLDIQPAGPGVPSAAGLIANPQNGT